METQIQHTPKLIYPNTCPRCGCCNTEYTGNDGTYSEGYYCHDCDERGEDDTSYEIRMDPEIVCVQWDDSDGQAHRTLNATWLVREAAPNLLEACKAIAALADGQGRANLMECAGQARAAISLAEKGA